MKLRILLLVALLCCQLVTAAANVPLMPVRDLRPGMHGIGKTVISGDTIENFDVEILGVNGSETSGYTIFVRLYGDLIERSGGVAKGMSGSPVYVDGRLVGAVAYGKGFDNPRYCFLTPISQMLSILDNPAASGTRTPYEWLPKGTSLMAGGFNEYGLAYLNEKLAPFGLDAVGSGVAGASSSKPLEPGSAVGAALMEGDLTLGALGTVTWMDDQGQLLAFGHPFMQRGDSNYFMTRAWVLGCVPNIQSGYKVGNIGESVGAITQDRSSGIGGKLGLKPSAVPLFVTVSDMSRGVNESKRMRAIDDPQLLPAIVDAAVVSVANGTTDRAGGGTAKVHFTITAADSKKEQLLFDRDNMFYTNAGILKTVDQELIDALSILLQNKLEDVKLYGIDVSVQLSEEVQVVEVTKAVAKVKEAQPGQKVPIEVTLKPYRGQEFTKTVEFVVPKGQRSGPLALNVRGGSSMAWIQNLLRKQREEGAPAAAEKKERKTSLKDFVKSVNDADKNNELIIDLAGGAPTAQNAGAQADGGLAGMLQGSPCKQKYPFEFIIDGETNITLHIK